MTKILVCGAYLLNITDGVEATLSGGGLSAPIVMQGRDGTFVGGNTRLVLYQNETKASLIVNGWGKTLECRPQ